MSDANATPEPPPEPPMVVRVEPAPPPPAPKRPRPGFVESILWCVLLWVVQVAGFLAAVFVVLGVHALQANDPRGFVVDELGATADAIKPPTEGAERKAIPMASSQSFAWGFLSAQLAMLGLIMLVVPRRVGPDWKRQIGVRWPHWFHVLLVVLVLPGFMIVSSGIEDVLVRWTGAKALPGTEALRGVFSPWPWWLTVLTVGIGPGVVEELWCRGFLGRGLCARYGLVAGVILTSVLFGLLHLHPVHAMVTACMGAYLHFVYLAARSIWVPVLLHALNNGVAVLATLAGVMVRLSDDPNSYTRVIYLTSISLVVFASVALWTARTQLLSVGVKEVTWRPEYPGISAPPPDADGQFGRMPPSPMAVVLTLTSFGFLVYLLSR
jgi:membrane protease YdiL (CAAX protease family)